MKKFLLFSRLFFILLFFSSIFPPASSSSSGGECKEVNKIADPAEQCRFVEHNPKCAIPSGYVNYAKSLYCTFQGSFLRPLGYIIFVFLLIFLLLALAMTSDRILTPNLSAIAQTFQLSENVAGETLLPFGNGAADIFTSIAAAMSLRDGDVGILYGTLLGSGAFTSTVIVGTIILVKPFHTMQRPLLRVIIFYMLAIFCSFVVIWDGVIEINEASVFFVLYLVYLLTVLLGPKINSFLIEWARKRRLKQEQQPSGDQIAMKNVVIEKHQENNGSVISDSGNKQDALSRGSSIRIVIEQTETGEQSVDKAIILPVKNKAGLRLELPPPAIRLKTNSLNATLGVDVHAAAQRAASVQRSVSARIVTTLSPQLSPKLLAPSPPEAGNTPPSIKNKAKSSSRNVSGSSSSAENARLSRVAKLLIREGSNRQERHRRHRRSRAGTVVVRHRSHSNRSSPFFHQTTASNNKQSSSSDGTSISKLEEFLIFDSSSSDEEEVLGKVDEKRPRPVSDIPLRVAVARTPSQGSASSGGPGRHYSSDYYYSSTVQSPTSEYPSMVAVNNNNNAVDIINNSRSFQGSPTLPVPPGGEILSLPGVDTEILEEAQEVFVFEQKIETVKDKPIWVWLLDGLNPIELDKWALQGWFWRTVQVLKVPVVFPILLTTSLVDEEKPLMNWNRPLNSLHCFTTPVFILIALNQIDLTIYEILPVIALVALFGLVFGLAVFFNSKINTERPKYHIVFAFMGFASTSMWIYVFANEVVNLIHCFGMTLNISQCLLGLTCLAWGNSVGDFINVIAVAKQGFSKMAISACFSGALFNMLLGLGVPILIITIKNGGQVQVVLPDILMVMFGFLGFAVASSLVAIPLIQGFYVRPPYSIYLFVIYAACLICLILTELGFLNLNF